MKKTENKFPPPMTMEERSLVFKFRDQLDQDVEYDEEYFDDSFLIRFLRARKLVLKDAFKMFSDYLKWREENDVDNAYKFEFPEEKKVKQYYPHTFHYTDKVGRPLYINKWDDLNFDEIFKITTYDRYIKFYIKKAENLIENMLPKASKAANKYIGQTCLVVDMRDFSANQIGKHLFNMMEKQFGLDMNYYPELLGQCLILNNSMVFKALWTIACGFLAESTRNKVKVFNENYRENLLNYVDEDKLPKFLGGNCECENGCINTNVGPWND